MLKANANKRNTVGFEWDWRSECSINLHGKVEVKVRFRYLGVKFSQDGSKKAEVKGAFKAQVNQIKLRCRAQGLFVPIQKYGQESQVYVGQGR